MPILNTIQPFYSKARWILFPSHNSKSPIWILKSTHVLRKHLICLSLITNTIRNKYLKVNKIS